MKEEKRQFGELLRRTREAMGLSREALAQCVDFDGSYIYRIEKGERRPSRDAAMALAEALGVKGEDLNKWLGAAGFAPVTLMTMVRGAVRARHVETTPAYSAGRDSARWASWLEAIGLQEAMISRLLLSMETAGLIDRNQAVKAIAAAFHHVTESLESPVRTAVIPAAGGHHRLMAPHVMQRLMLRAIGEAMESGLTEVVMVLAPGMKDFLYQPIKEALELAIVPFVRLHCVEQTAPAGLGHAVLQAEDHVGGEPFAVLLPDDVIRERIGRLDYQCELRRMIQLLPQLGGGASLVAVTSVPKSKMAQYGVVRLGAKETASRLFPITQLVEKPDASNPVFRSPRISGIVGRYILQPEIFGFLRALSEKRETPLQLTSALENLRQAGRNFYAFEMRAVRQDLGEVIGQAGEMLG